MIERELLAALPLKLAALVWAENQVSEMEWREWKQQVRAKSLEREKARHKDGP